MEKTVNVEVSKTGTENTLTLLRRFSKKVQGSGIIKRVRSLRYATRSLSKFTRKKQALKRIGRRAHFEEQKKLGKISNDR